MSEIWSLDAICRCCHADGVFKSLNLPYLMNNSVEIYSVILQETLGINMIIPEVKASVTICDNCITELRNAQNFKLKVLECERKFEEYCKNEQSVNYDIKVEPTFQGSKVEPESDNDIPDDDNYPEPDYNEEKNPSTANIKKEGEDSRIEISIEIPKVENKSNVTKRKKGTKKQPTDKSKIKRIKIKPKEEESLIVKVKTETGEVFSCKTCGITYDAIDELNEHISETHVTRYKCFHCEEVFINGQKFKKHCRDMHNETKPFKCIYCDKQLTTRDSLNTHVNSLHKTKINWYKCDICQNSFKHKQTLKVHIKKHLGTLKKFICDQCGLTCNDITNLKIHIMTVHEKIKRFECTECGKKFGASKHLKIHIRTHTGEKPFECDICQVAFASNDTLTQHKKKHSSIPRRHYKCKICNEVSSTRGEFASHTRSHVGYKPFKCHLCEKDFSCKYTLKRHIFEHSGEKPFKCELCQMSFAGKSQLYRHKRRIHDPNKQPVVKEKCHLCNRSVPYLEKHIEAHMNRKHKCHLCDKSYPAKNALNRHLDRHAGVKHPCDLCSRAFVQLRTLIKHKLKIHKLPLKTEQEDHYDSVVNTYIIKNVNK